MATNTAEVRETALSLDAAFAPDNLQASDSPPGRLAALMIVSAVACLALGSALAPMPDRIPGGPVVFYDCKLGLIQVSKHASASDLTDSIEESAEMIESRGCLLSSLPGITAESWDFGGPRGLEPSGL